jgi:hypothetical protein
VPLFGSQNELLFPREEAEEEEESNSESRLFKVPRNRKFEPLIRRRIFKTPRGYSTVLF